VTRRQPVAVVTGGGGGIGAAIAEELGRTGSFVVTVDPMVSVDGSEQLPAPAETTAGRIVAGGGSARASGASVTDAGALEDLFQELTEEHGGIDAVVNVAGFTRQSYFARGTEEDWLALLTVHLGGYLNVLEAALPRMAATGYGRVLGVTSGSGWRAADAGGYSAAKRAVAALTWQLGRVAPPGVSVNAISPIAATRMVAAALERARKEGRAGGGGGLSLNSMPGPEDLGPLAAYLVGEKFGWCSGQVVFAGGPEAAVVDQPRLLELVRTDGAASVAHVLDSVVPTAFATAESTQASGGGTNPRFGPIFDEPERGGAPAVPVRTCVIVSDRPQRAKSLAAILEARSISSHQAEVRRGFAAAGEALQDVIQRVGPVDAVVIALATPHREGLQAEDWEAVLADHRGLVECLHADAAWSRAATDYSTASGRPLRLLTLTDAAHPAGKSRAQASAQLARVAAGATERRVTAFAAGVEAAGTTADDAAGELVAHLLSHPDAAALAGAELVVGAGWIGLRSHPRPTGTVTYGGPTVPSWFDATLREAVGATGQSPVGSLP
jgi:NAD(P)-dependent dehydrogenase (short-subunit alcohol dehydrogenase family)